MITPKEWVRLKVRLRTVQLKRQINKDMKSDHNIHLGGKVAAELL